MITVTGGQYSLLLGDTSLPNMTDIPESVFNNSEVFIRIWFSDGTNGSQHLTPDQSIQTNCAAPTTEAWHRRTLEPHGGVDRQPNDRLGRTRRQPTF